MDYTKKSLLRIILGFMLLGIFAIPLVSAQSFDLYQGSNNLINSIERFATPFFEVLIGDYSGSEFFFAKCLFLILLFIMIDAILKKVPLFQGNNAVIFIIALVVSVLGVRFISDNEFTQMILLPYGTLGIVLTTVLPFIIVFYFLHSMNAGGAARRILWLFFIVVFGALWYSKRNTLLASNPIGNQIYMWTLVAMAGLFIFDRGIHRYFAIHEMNIFYTKAKQKTVASLQAEYMNILNVDSPQANARRQQIETELKRHGADIP
jgi:hypothetical protein